MCPLSENEYDVLVLWQCLAQQKANNAFVGPQIVFDLPKFEL